MTQMQLVETITIDNGRKAFSGELWKEALLFWLQGIWSGEISESHRTWITLNEEVVIHGSSGRMRRYCGGRTCEIDAGHRSNQSIFLKREDMLCVDIDVRGVGLVESGMIRFVRNPQLRQLELTFYDGMRKIVLTKGHPDSQLIVSGENLPIIY